jgi:hypothetical protein
MLEYARPCDTRIEHQFIARFIAPLPNAYQDPFGNWHVIIGESPILWSRHTDTVHRSARMQTTHYDRTTGLVSLSARSIRSGASCLGADDTAGIWLCVQMINACVPGHYIFHFGEESGGIGSSALAEDAPSVLSHAQYAIALDRAGYSDIITHQGGTRTASNVFADYLSKILSRNGLTFAPCDRGIFTDTANYTDIIGE